MNYENRIVAFIDILGFKELVRKSESNLDIIETLNNILQYLKTWERPIQWSLDFVEIESSTQRKGVEKFDLKNRTNVTTFSDSIVVSVKIDEDNINEMLSSLIANLSYMGSELMKKGILIRGAITIGKLIHNDNGTVFGTALIEAYELESKCSKYPRIIISNKLVRRLNYPDITKRSEYLYNQYFMRFSDGCVGFHQMIFFQVMNGLTGITNEIRKKDLNIIRKVIIDGLDNSFENPDVFEKFKWLQQQYQNLIILNNDFITEENPIRDELKKEIFDLNERDGFCIHYGEKNKY